MYHLYKRLNLYRTRLQNKINRIALPDYTLFSIYAIITGAVVGLAAVFFHNSIEFFNEIFFEQTTEGLFFLGAGAVIVLPALGMLIQSVMIYFRPKIAKRRGVTEVIKSVAMRGGYIPLRTTIFHFIAPVISIGSGGTVGPEGPAAQLGGGLASKLGNLLGLSDARRRMFTAAGSGAAISAIFNTPLGGIFFALEIILLNDFQSATFSALILASVTASAISRIFLGDTPAFIFETPSIGSYDQLYLFAILGIAAGLLSLLFIRYSNILDRLFQRKILPAVPRWLVMLIVGLLVGLCGYFYKDIFGIGYNAINHILADETVWQVVVILLVMKFILVPLMLYSGGFGGIFAPSLFMGACFGYLYAFALNYFWGLNVDTTTYVLVSMGAVLGGINSIPIASILIIFEMTKDYTFILPLMLAVVISTTIVQLILKGSVHVKHLEEMGYSISDGRERNILRSIQVKDVMRADVVITPEDTPLPELIHQLLESPHGTFYTVNEENKLNGIISENELRPLITEYEQIKEMLIARDIVNPNVIKINEFDDLDYVLKMFGKATVDEFPVVSNTDPDKVIGTIWRQDVIAAYNRESIKYNLADGLAYELKAIQKSSTSSVAEGYSIVEKRAPAMFVGKTLVQLKLRNEYGL